jgi:FAD:protein FMN transferase
MSRFVLLALIAALPATASAQVETQELRRFGRTELHMGSDFTVKFYAPSEDVAERAFAAAFGVIAEYDRILSDYNPESELSQLVKRAPTDPIPVSKPFWEVMLRAGELMSQTDGALDVTVGPLTRLWRRARRQRELPTEEERRAALEAVGWKHVVLDRDRQAIGLSKPGMRLDLGAFAPGYAADQALAKLAEMGINSALVDASGDVVVGEPPPGEKGWKVGIAPLLDASADPDRILIVSHCSVATSGDAFRGVEIEGVRYSHIVDPKTGLGVKHRSSVTVIGPNAATADAIATALTVMGPDAALRFVKRVEGVETRIVTTTSDGQIRELQSPGFARFVAVSAQEAQAP